MAERIAFVACILFFVAGLATGVWKYVCIRRSKESRAPRYVNVSHTAALFYSTACLVLLELVRQSRLCDSVEAWTVSLVVAFFACAFASYIVHGIMADTGNQLARPHRLGSHTIDDRMVTLFMSALICAEMGGVILLFVGAFI